MLEKERVIKEGTDYRHCKEIRSVFDLWTLSRKQRERELEM